jgi:23S rRNA (guanine745-N1)-methyltransferase
MALSRRDFLNKGYFAPLAQAVGGLIEEYSSKGDAVLDVCCGEGWYTDYLNSRLDREFYGFDLSKNMVRLAAKRGAGTFFCANISSIPIRTGSVKVAFQLFAPFHSAELSRVIDNDGIIISAAAGERHLWQLKQVLYDKPYENEEKPPEAEELRLLKTFKISSKIALPSKQDIWALFKMTPYYYHTPTEGMKRLEALDGIETEVEFLISVFSRGSLSTP